MPVTHPLAVAQFVRDYGVSTSQAKQIDKLLVYEGDRGVPYLEKKILGILESSRDPSKTRLVKSKKKYRAPIYMSSRWAVETLDRYGSGKWLTIYTSKTKAKAMQDAKNWTKETGQKTRVVPGEGHATRRDPTNANRNEQIQRKKAQRDHLPTSPGGFNVYLPMFRTTDGNWISIDSGFQELEPAKKRADAIRREGSPSRVEEHAFNHLAQRVGRIVVYTSNAQPRKYPKRDAAPNINPVCPVGTEIQTLVLSQQFFNEKQAASWVRRNHFRVSKIDQTANNWRFRQHSPSEFQEGSFRTIRLRAGVNAVIGCPKQHS